MSHLLRLLRLLRLRIAVSGQSSWRSPIVSMARVTVVWMMRMMGIKVTIFIILSNELHPALGLKKSSFKHIKPLRKCLKWPKIWCLLESFKHLAITQGSYFEEKRLHILNIWGGTVVHCCLVARRSCFQTCHLNGALLCGVCMFSTGLHGFTPGIQVSFHMCECACECLFVSPEIDWQHVKGIPCLLPDTSWDWLLPPHDMWCTDHAGGWFFMCCISFLAKKGCAMCHCSF